MKRSWLVALVYLVAQQGFAADLLFTADSFFYGPAVTRPTSTETVTAEPGGTYGVMVQNQVGLRYWIENDLSVAGVFDFALHSDQGAALSSDSFIKLNKSSILSARFPEGEMWLDGEARVFLPTSEFSQRNGIWGSVRAALNPSIELAHSPFSFTMVNFIRYWPNFTQVSLYTGPQVNYRINDRFLFWMLFEKIMTYNDVAPFGATDFEPGLDIRVGNGLRFTPYLNWYTSQPLKTVSFNLTTSLAL